MDINCSCHESVHSTKGLGECSLGLVSYPGLLTLVFVACSTNVVGGLVKLSHVQ